MKEKKNGALKMMAKKATVIAEKQSTVEQKFIAPSSQ